MHCGPTCGEVCRWANRNQGYEDGVTETRLVGAKGVIGEEHQMAETLGVMNPYGSEGPSTCADVDAARKAASTPPALGSMNPYGGEGPPRVRQAQVKQWWSSFRELETWTDTHGFPSRNARRGDEKRLAKWWHHVTNDKRKTRRRAACRRCLYGSEGKQEFN